MEIKYSDYFKSFKDLEVFSRLKGISTIEDYQRSRRRWNFSCWEPIFEGFDSKRNGNHLFKASDDMSREAYPKLKKTPFDTVNIHIDNQVQEFYIKINIKVNFGDILRFSPSAQIITTYELKYDSPGELLKEYRNFVLNNYNCAGDFFSQFETIEAYKKGALEPLPDEKSLLIFKKMPSNNIHRVKSVSHKDIERDNLKGNYIDNSGGIIVRLKEHFEKIEYFYLNYLHHLETMKIEESNFNYFVFINGGNMKNKQQQLKNNWTLGLIFSNWVNAVALDNKLEPIDDLMLAVDALTEIKTDMVTACNKNRIHTDEGQGYEIHIFLKPGDKEVHGFCLSYGMGNEGKRKRDIDYGSWRKLK